MIVQTVHCECVVDIYAMISEAEIVRQLRQSGFDLKRPMHKENRPYDRTILFWQDRLIERNITGYEAACEKMLVTRSK